jgi:hypothetical protein
VTRLGENLPPVQPTVEWNIGTKFNTFPIYIGPLYMYIPTER